MAYKVANINDLFRVKSDGAIEFGTSGAGTATYVLTSAGANATPTWTEPTTGTVTSVKVNADSGNATATAIVTSGIFTFTGGDNITTSVSGKVVTIDTDGIVTGSGTLNKVARWTADGSDIGDGPITFSAATAAANSTFGGDVNVKNAATRIISLNYEDNANSIISHSGTNYGLESLNVRGDTIRFYTDYDAASPKGNITLTLDTGHNATFTGTVSGTTATFTTFFGDLNGTINTATTAVTQPNAADNTKVATTAYVVNKIAELPAGLIFLGTWNADTNDPTLASGGGERSEGTTTTVTANKLIDSAATFTTAPAVVVGDRVRVVTPAGPEFALVTSVDSATQLTLAADIVTDTGEAYILEVSPFLLEGNYYIVSDNGAEDLNGITDWKVGDWVVASSTNVWQKIDNSSVLDGSGTGQSVAKWDGSGTSNTLTNGPITFSGGVSTFNIDADSVFKIGDGGTNAVSITAVAGDELYIGANNAYQIRLKTDGDTVFDNGSNVGIGTSSPDYTLDVEKDVDTWLARIYNTGNDANAQGLLIRSDANSSHDASVMGVYADGGYKMVVKSTGNVGIGTSTPQTTLDVKGAASALNAHFGQGANNSSGVFGGISLGYSEATNDGYRKVGIVAKAIGDGAARQDLNFLVDTVADGNSAGIADSKMMISGTTGQVNISKKPNSGLGYDLLINLGTSPDGLIGYQTREQFNNATLQKWYNVDAANSGSSQWVRLGTMSNFAQGGYTFCLTFFGHTGYNASNDQDFNCKLFMKTSNGGGAGPRFNSWVENTGKNQASPAFKWINTNASGTPTVGGTSFELYMNVPAYCNGSIYAINKHSGDWTSENAVGQTDPGANSTTVLQAQNIFNILNTNVGIGTTSPNTPLDVNGNIYSSTRVQGGVALMGTSNVYATFGSNSSARAIAISRDYAPTTYPDIIVSTSGNTTIGGTSQYGGTGVRSLNIQATSYPVLAFYGGASPGLYTSIFSYYNRTSFGHSNSGADWQFNNGTTRASISGSGTFTAAGDVVAYGSPSDKRLKENIKPIESALNKVMKLKGVTFDWKQKEDSILELKEDIGFIAQDVQKVVPELVRENKDGMLSMRHQGVAPILLEAIKELKAEIDELKKCNCNCNK